MLMTNLMPGFLYPLIYKKKYLIYILSHLFFWRLRLVVSACSGVLRYLRLRRDCLCSRCQATHTHGVLQRWRDNHALCLLISLRL